MDSLRRSFRSDNPATDEDRRPILSEHHLRSDHPSVPDDEHASAAGGGNPSDPAGHSKVWKNGSYEFWKEVEGVGANAASGADESGRGSELEFTFRQQQQQHQLHQEQHEQYQQQHQQAAEIGDDPPTRLISSFLRQQRASGGDVALDIDFEMEDMRNLAASGGAGFADFNGDPYGQDHELRRRSSANRDSSADAGVSGEQGVFSSSSSLRRSPRVALRPPRPKSRLMDPPPLPPRSSSAAAENGERRNSGGSRASQSSERAQQQSRQIRSGRRSGALEGDGPGQNGNPPTDDDDDQLGDLPEDYRLSAHRLSKLSMLQLVTLLIILAALACSLSVPALCRRKLWDLALWKWEALALALVCGRLVSGWAVRAAVYVIERNFMLRKRVLYFVYALRGAAQNCIWMGLVLLAWHLMFDKKVQQQTKSEVLPYVTKVILCLFVANLLRLVKTVLIKVVASSFHVNAYFDRIHDSLFVQYVVQTLSGPPIFEASLRASEEEENNALRNELNKFQRAGAIVPPDLQAAVNCNNRVKPTLGAGSRDSTPRSVRLSGPVKKKDSNGEGAQEQAIPIDLLHKMNQKNVSAWNMKRLISTVRHGALGTLDDKLASAGKEDESTMRILSERQAIVAAKKIFQNVAKPGAKYIEFDDLLRFMRENEAVKTMALFEGAQEANRVGRKTLKNWLVNAFRERKVLSLTLNDTKTAVKKLNQMVNVVLGIIVFAIWLLILGVADSRFFVLLSSQILLSVFIFGNTCKMTFESIIFLFVMHPFDVGDRCEVEGVQMVVEEMNILTTVFLRYDNLKVAYPNSVLATKPIANFWRSPEMGDSVDFCIHVSTPVEKIALMKEKIKGFIQSKQEHWHPTPEVVLKDVEDMNKLIVSVWLLHRMNHQDMGERWLRREQVVQEMIRVLKELDIEYRMLPLDVNVRDMPPPSSSRIPSTWATFS